MERIINIGDKDVKLNNNIGWTYVYKNQFGGDIIPTLMPVLNAVLNIMSGIFQEVENRDEIGLEDVAKITGSESFMEAMIQLSGLEFTDFLNITWALAKKADASIDPPERWYDQFDTFPTDEVIVEVFDFIFQGSTSSKKYQRLKEMFKSLQPKKNQSTLKKSSSQELKED